MEGTGDLVLQDGHFSLRDFFQIFTDKAVMVLDLQALSVLFTVGVTMHVNTNMMVV